MKPFRPAVAAVMLTALLAVPAHADHKRFGGFVFIEPLFVPVPERPLRSRWRQQSGYPVALVRRRLRGIGFSRIGQFDVYPGSYGVTATDPGGVRVNLVIDRWSGDVVRARAIKPAPAARRQRPPAAANRAPAKAPRKTHKVAALRVPPLPRSAPERLTQTANITPSAERVDLEETPPATVDEEDIVTSSISRPAAAPEIDPIGEIILTPPAVAVAPRREPEAEAPPVAEVRPPVAEAPTPVAKVPLPEPKVPVAIALVPKLPAIAEPDPVAEAVVHAPEPARPASTMPVTRLQGERFDPADSRDRITDY